MIDMLKRHAIQVLRAAGHPQSEIATLTDVSIRSVRRVEAEPDVSHVDDAGERDRRRIGRPSIAEPFRRRVVELLTQDPALLSVEIFRRAKLAGYPGGKSALYDLIHAIRPKAPRPVVRFEGLPGEFTQHDFGQVDVRYLDGAKKRIHFFASRLKYSRWVEVTIVPDEQAVFDAAELILKVKEPQPEEVAMLRREHTLFTYLHLAPDPELTRGLVESGATCGLAAGARARTAAWPSGARRCS